MKSCALLLVSCLVVGSQAWQFSRLLNDDELRSNRHQIRIDLQQPRIEALREINHDISNPDSPNFGKYLTNDEVRSFVGQSDYVMRQLKTWLNNAECNFCPGGISEGVHGDYLYAYTCLARLECLFNVKFGAYVQEHQVVVRSIEAGNPRDLEALNVPEELREYIFRVNHVIDLPVQLRYQGKIVEKSEFKGEEIDPNLIRSNYGVDQYDTPSASGPQGKQACGEFQYEYWQPSDLVKMQNYYDLPENNVSNIIGADNPKSPYSDLGEASLDFQYITTVADLETWGFIEPGFSFSLIDYCQKVAATDGAPLVHSLSYGGTESSLGEDTCFRSSDEFMKMTSQGFTFLVASGDDGTGSSSYFSCPSFDPLFPAVSPYVTAVGATYLEQGSDNPECSITFSGSGFSNYFARPDYQDSYVQDYFDNVSQLPSSYLYNSSGRGIPDVAAYGTNFNVMINGDFELLAGTSASTPVFAAMVAFANAERASNGQSALGNINQRLYKSGSVGTDIDCGKSKANECTQGFYTADGWDAATGLGTPLASVLFPLLTKD